MPLHPEAEAARQQRAQQATAPLYTLTLAEARARDLAEIKAGSGQPEPVGEIWHREIPGPPGSGTALTIRGYEPLQRKGIGPLPVFVYFFGGGWTLGDLDTCDGICRALTNAVGCVTVSVRYRRAPEHPFPAAVEDCYAAVSWVGRNLPGRLAVGGDSAGGNLAAAVSLRARDDRQGPAICHQLLVYPNTDCLADSATGLGDEDPALFNRHSVRWYWGHYLADPADGGNPLASPLRAPSHRGLPPATVITAEYDPLRDEGEAYARKLADAGVPVELRRYDGMAHGFFAMPGTFTLARDAQAYAAARLAAAYA